VELTGPHTASAAELKARLEVERRGAPFLVLRDGAGVQRLIALEEGRERLTVGRSDECDLALAWDEGVSRVHAQLENQLQRTPTEEEMATKLGVEVEDFRKTLLEIANSSVLALDDLWTIADADGGQISLLGMVGEIENLDLVDVAVTEVE